MPSVEGSAASGAFIDVAGITGQIRGRIPDLPILTIAQASVGAPLGKTSWTPVIRKQDRERWNDWGIGLLLQGDLKGAQAAFVKVTEIAPSNPDGWVNIGRSAVRPPPLDYSLLTPYGAR